MNIVVVSESRAWERHILRVMGGRHEIGIRRSFESARRAVDATGALMLVHADQLDDAGAGLAAGAAGAAGPVFGVAANTPTLEGMLAVTRLGARAYFNCFMADLHYAQMIALLADGQSWFAPALLESALDLARRNLESAGRSEALSDLTPREREIALDIARGMTNREVASLRRIAESSVKTHLTHIFKKLEVRSRTELAVTVGRTQAAVAQES